MRLLRQGYRDLRERYPRLRRMLERDVVGKREGQIPVLEPGFRRLGSVHLDRLENFRYNRCRRRYPRHGRVRRPASGLQRHDRALVLDRLGLDPGLSLRLKHRNMSSGIIVKSPEVGDREVAPPAATIDDRPSILQVNGRT